LAVSRIGRIDAKQIRRELADPRSLCALRGFEGKAKPQQGGGLLILCPAHDEKTPSCSVTVGPDGTVRACCFSCGFTGDALHLVALARKLNIRTDFRSVLFEAAALARATTPSERPITRSESKALTSLPAQKIDAVLQTLLPVSTSARALRCG